MKFNQLDLNESLLEAIGYMNYEEATPIQEQAIPLILEGNDLIGCAQTGTGKTLAFGIPLIHALIQNPHSTAMVITPTRELAQQVLKALQQLLGDKPVARGVLLIGGDSMHKQLQALKRRPRLFVGTPGRINDHLTRGTIDLNQTGFLVLDETDRMLDMGFSVQIEKILQHMPAQRQTLLFSATIPANVVKLTQKYLTEPEHITIEPDITVSVNIKQDTKHIDEGSKYVELLSQLDKREGSIIVFVKTKRGAEKMAKRLKADHHRTDTIHGDLRQNKRERVIQAFRKRKYRILVATDVAARGLDIPHIEHVINYDLPQCPEDYIHRIGRTGRASASGEALSFITRGDRGKWNEIERLLNPEKAGKSDSAKAERPARAPRGQGKNGKPNSKRTAHGAPDGFKAKKRGSRKPGKKPFRFKQHSRRGAKPAGGRQRQRATA